MGDPLAPDHDPNPPVFGPADAARAGEIRARLQQVYVRVRDAQAASSRAISAGHSDPATLAETLVADAYRLVDDVAKTSPAQAEVECTRGCSFCCHQQVRVSAPEAIALAAALSEAFPVAWLDQLRAMLAQRVTRIAGFASVREHVAAKLPCAFLAPDGDCGVYAWRPVVCRGFHSLSRMACQHFYIDLAHRPPPIERLGHYAASAVLRGLTNVISADHRDGGFYELHGAVLRALDTPDCAVRWAAGEDVFAGCKPS